MHRAEPHGLAADHRRQRVCSAQAQPARLVMGRSQLHPPIQLQLVREDLLAIQDRPLHNSTTLALSPSIYELLISPECRRCTPDLYFYSIRIPLQPRLTNPRHVVGRL